MDFDEIAALVGMSADDALQKLRSGPFEVERIDFAYPDEAVYLLGKHCGIELAITGDGKVSTVWLHSGRRGHVRYQGPLPPGIAFATGRSLVRAVLGRPSFSGDGFDDHYIGKQGCWDRWDRSNHLLHIQYGFEEDVIELLTIMHSDWRPGMGTILPSRKRWWQFWRWRV